MPTPTPSEDLHHLNMKSEADRRKTFGKWQVAFIDKNHLQQLEFITQTGMFCPAPFVDWKYATGKKGTTHSKTTKGSDRLMSSLMVSVSGTFLLVLPASSTHHLNSLPEAATYAGLNAGNILVCISSVMCASFRSPY